jgi:hypothetical protein
MLLNRFVTKDIQGSGAIVGLNTNSAIALSVTVLSDLDF